MAALLACFRKRQRKPIISEECEKTESECSKGDVILHCGSCKATLVGHWKRNELEDGADGRRPSASGPLCITSPCMDSCDSSPDVSPASTPSDGNSPTRLVPPLAATTTSGFRNSAYVNNDYRPSAQSGISGMSYMPVSKESLTYNMAHRRRGKAVIFNFAKWNNTSIPTMDLKPRQGSDKDKNDLKNCLEGLSFEVVCYDNLVRQKYDKIIKKLRKEDHSDADCLVIAIMTHGENNKIYLSDGSLIPVNSVWEEFEANRCPTLAGKPKIFIIQACRGDKYDDGTRLIPGASRAPAVQNDVIDSGSFSYVIPNAADILVAFSCPLGHYSWRHPERGSWFIQSICKVFNSVGRTEELQSMLTSVAREVAVNYESSTDSYDSDRKKQVPSTSSTLIRKVFFPPKVNLTLPNLVPALQQNTVTIHSEITSEQVQAAVASAQLIAAEPAPSSIPSLNRNQAEVIPLQLSVLDGAPSQSQDELISVIPSDLSDQATPVGNETVPS